MMKETSEIKKTNPVVETILTMVSSAKYTLKRELGNIAIIIQLLAPVVIAEISRETYEMILISFVFMVVLKFIRELGYELNKTTESDSDEDDVISVQNVTFEFDGMTEDTRIEISSFSKIGNCEIFIDNLMVTSEEKITDRGKMNFCIPSKMTSKFVSGQLSISGNITINGNIFSLPCAIFANVL